MSAKIAKSFSLYTIGQFLTQALSFILLPIYINKLSQEEYGIVAFFMAFGFFLNAVMQYGFSPTLLRYYFDFKENQQKLKSYISTLLIFMILGNIFILLLIVLFQGELFGFLSSGMDYERYIYYIIGYSFLFTFPLLTLALFRVKGQPKKYLLFNIVQFAMSFLLIYYFVAILEAGALGKIKGEFWARVPLFLFSFYLYKDYITCKGLKVEYLKSALKFGIPLMLQSLLWWGLYRLDFFLIENNLGSEGLGLYNVAFQISFVLITIGISFSLAWTPHFFAIADQKRTPILYGNLMGNFCLLLSLSASLILFFGKEIILMMGGEKYLGIFEFLPWLLFGAVFQSSYYLAHQTIQYSKKTVSIPVILGLGVLIGFVAEYLVVKRFGLMGISIVKFFTFGSVFILTFMVGQKSYKVKLSANKITIALSLLAMNYGLSSFLGEDVRSIAFKTLILVANVILIWKILPFFTENERKMILKKIGKA